LLCCVTYHVPEDAGAPPRRRFLFYFTFIIC